MERIIDGIRFVGKPLADCWDVRVFEVNGHRETSARPTISWVEDTSHGTGAPYTLDHLSAAQLKRREKEDERDELERREAALKKSATRAKTMCRRVIKAEGFNELLTLTYRENQTDRELCKKHFKEWVRRMKKALGDFRFCASFEKQDRGAMHIHCATHKLPTHALYKHVKVKAWEVGTRIWRDIIGNTPRHGPCRPGDTLPPITNGLCFVGGKPKQPHQKRRKNMSIAKMAGYVSKYILKDYEDSPAEKNRYSRSNGTVIPKAVLVQITACSFADLIGLCFQCPDGDVVVSHNIGTDFERESYWLVTEPDQSLKVTNE